jgi:hypothetical protein
MSASEEEEGQDYHDILGFPGDGFKDNDDVDPDESLLTTCCGSKSLKVILIDSDFGYYPLLNPLVTL